ncbi:hypothetical protein GQ53DRAFT_538122 [Thozetella sp. PMI_491]|nr:hypothetical protein GQ53DRAFT_538122 [Thozetella sp. PMI_491]
MQSVEIPGHGPYSYRLIIHPVSLVSIPAWLLSSLAVWFWNRSSWMGFLFSFSWTRGNQGDREDHGIAAMLAMFSCTSQMIPNHSWPRGEDTFTFTSRSHPSPLCWLGDILLEICRWLVHTYVFF